MGGKSSEFCPEAIRRASCAARATCCVGSEWPDAGILRACLRACQQMIQLVGRKHALSACDLEDFRQDAWLAILRSLQEGRFNPRAGRLRDWLYVVARNRAVSLLRRRQLERRDVIEVRLDQLRSPATSNPLTALLRQSDIQRVRVALTELQQRLSPTSYAVFYARNMHQRSVSEVARQIGLTNIQVRVYDHRARKRLRTLLRRDR